MCMHENRYTELQSQFDEFEANSGQLEEEQRAELAQKESDLSQLRSAHARARSELDALRERSLTEQTAARTQIANLQVSSTSTQLELGRKGTLLLVCCGVY